MNTSDNSSEMKLQSISLDELLAFISDEKQKHNDLTEDETNIIGPEQSYSFISILGITVDDLVVGFCLVPTYDKTIATRLYVARDYRRKGYAKQTLNTLRIERLNCLMSNIAAMKLYESIGFRSRSISFQAVEFSRSLS